MNGVNNVRSDVNRKVWRLFKEHGIKIPVAQQEVRVLDPAREDGRGELPYDVDPRR
jgi:small-conductance mechanosensitive channel